MIKMFRFYSIITMFITLTPLFAASPTSPCDTSTSSTACKLVWSSNNPEGFKNSHVHTDDNHNGQVFCSPPPGANANALDELSSDNKVLTINYLGNRHTCYTRIDNLINHDQGDDNHGYVEATIIVNNDAGNFELWPAFWLVGANWPTQGEIDISEGWFGKVQTFLHGDPNPMVATPLGSLAPGLGFYDNKRPHTYGVEWQLLGDNQIIINIYYDNIFQYSSQVNDTNQTPYSQIKKGLQSGTMSLIFDADQGPDLPSDVKYSMTVSNVNVYSITP